AARNAMRPASASSAARDAGRPVPRPAEAATADAPPVSSAARDTGSTRLREPGAWGATARDRGESPTSYPPSRSRGLTSETSVLKTVQEYFTGGNTLVRVGILILFFGVAFL